MSKLNDYIITSEDGEGKKKTVIGFYARDAKEASMMFNDIKIEDDCKYQLYKCTLCKGYEINGRNS